MTQSVDKQSCDELLTQPGQEPDEELFNRIVSCFGTDLQRFARYRCGNPDEAQDVYQEALLAAYRYLSGFRGDASLKTWLFKLVSSACIKQHRGMKNNSNLHDEFDPSLADHALDMEKPPDVSMLVREKFQALIDSMNQLTEEDQTMLMLKENDGLSIMELADRTGLSVSNVKVRLHRARNKLREELNKKGLEPSL